MKRSVILSTVVHMGVILGLFLSSPMKPMLQGYPTIYRVGLVSMPRRGGGGKGSPGEAAKAKLTVSKQTEKGVSVKELNKKPPKKKKQTQKTPPAKTETVNAKKDTPSKKETGTITQQDESGAEYGLGNGISAATVDGMGFGSSYYLSLVFGRIRDLWENPVQASAILRVTVYFKILRDGQILDSQVEKSSGIDLFDQSAMRAIISGAPFPPLPIEYRGEYLGIHLEFEYIQ
jgi:TonB family protein